MVRVLLARNHAAVRDGIRRFLADSPLIPVVGDAADLSEAITKTHKIRPDVLILDIYIAFEPNLSLRELSAQLNSCGAGILGIPFANDDDARSLATNMGAPELWDKMQLGTVDSGDHASCVCVQLFPPPSSAKPRDSSELR